MLKQVRCLKHVERLRERGFRLRETEQALRCFTVEFVVSEANDHPRHTAVVYSLQIKSGLPNIQMFSMS